MESGMFKLTIFLVASAGLFGISRKAIRKTSSHGFFRFFAWEAILALILVNIDSWFSHPFAPIQIVSWILLTLSLLLLSQGVYLLRVMGRPDTAREDETLMPFEKTSNVVTAGVYGYIRHPLYASLLFLAWGAFLKQTAWYSACLVVVATACLIATAKADERECLQHFGSSYKEYMSRTKMFIPYLY
jgi:protein-S-isoprenylcysteine O-methyltransferase Ste14